ECKEGTAELFQNSPTQPTRSEDPRLGIVLKWKKKEEVTGIYVNNGAPKSAATIPKPTMLTKPCAARSRAGLKLGDPTVVPKARAIMPTSMILIAPLWDTLGSRERKQLD